LQYKDIAATCWSDLFETEFQQILSFHQRAVIRPETLRTKDGGMLFAQVHSHSLARQALSANTKAAPATPISPTTNEDAQWLAASERARKVIDKAIPLLVTGESGVGKELFAQATHRASLRRNKPFVAVNCAAIPEHLIEAELFGYVAGAFTGATKQGAQGRLREAHGGTLFLDEIGDMPLSLQTRLLRVYRNVRLRRWAATRRWRGFQSNLRHASEFKKQHCCWPFPRRSVLPHQWFKRLPACVTDADGFCLFMRTTIAGICTGQRSSHCT
jgi:transcriptional regulator of acetoin/glycerol metabolism